MFSPYIKAWIALIGSTASALVGIMTPDTVLFHLVTAVVVIATALLTFQVPNGSLSGGAAAGPGPGI